MLKEILFQRENDPKTNRLADSGLIESKGKAI